jgi:hypothetical protein
MTVYVKSVDLKEREFRRGLVGRDVIVEVLGKLEAIEG